MSPPKEKKKARPQSSSAGLLSRNRATLKAFLIFALTIAVCFTVLISHLLDRVLVYPFTVLVAKTSSVILNIFGYGTAVAGTFLKSAQKTLNIGTGCNGLEAVAIFISAIIAFPARLKSKLSGLLLGFLGIFIINQTRVVGLFLVNLYAPQHLDLAHTYIGQTYVIISGVALWILWAEKNSNVSQKNTAAVS